MVREWLAPCVHDAGSKKTMPSPFCTSSWGDQYLTKKEKKEKTVGEFNGLVPGSTKLTI